MGQGQAHFIRTDFSQNWNLVIYLENKTKQTIRPRRKLKDVEISKMEYILIVQGGKFWQERKASRKGRGKSESIV